MKKRSSITRRAFLATTTLSATTVLAQNEPKPNTAEVVPGKKSPNDTLNLAAIGSGGKGGGDIMSCASENVVALCDVDWDRAGKTFEELPNAKRFRDYRHMLEQMPEIDAVTISTPDHTHAPAAYMAMKMGKGVYVQKPLTHTVAEARLL
ncbi:MAG: Gfo/Idh/MocA family oxidoreductase, partial [Candidatus Hydrogenedentes bacterium]|nr:Gfo/Idh/MocA family oxidoreductase [Candidatus Hydrogenedentota bacterium]